MDSPDETEAPILAEVAVPLGASIRAYRRGEFDSAVDQLLAVRGEIQRIGGSHAQRDIFHMILLDAAHGLNWQENCWSPASSRARVTPGH